MARPVIQFTRITNASRLPDRFLACQVREFYETGLPEQARLFVVLEIARPWLAASQIGQAILHAFTLGYQSAGDESDVTRVELALKRVNETLVHLTQQGETEWIGHLHAVFVIEKLGVIHVAQTGRAAAFLVRDGAVSRITDAETAQSAASANHTFGTVTSGTLEPGDGLIVGSAEFFRAIPPELAEQTLADSPAAEAAARYVRLLRQQQTRGTAAIIARVYDQRSVESQPLATDPEVLYLDGEPLDSLSETLKRVGRAVKRMVLAIGHQLDRANQSIDSVARNTLAPKGKALVVSGIAASQKHWQTLRTETVPGALKVLQPRARQLYEQARALATGTKSARESTRSATGRQTASVNGSTTAGLVGRDLYTVRHYTEATRAKWPLPNLTFARRRWRLPSIAALTRLLWGPRFYMITAGVLLVLLVGNIYLLQRKQRERSTANEAVAAVQGLRQRYDDAKLQIAFKKADAATQELSAILAELEPLMDTAPASARAAALTTDVEDSLDGLTHTTRVRSPKKVVTFPGANGLTRLASDLVTAVPESNQLLSSPIAGELIDSRATLPAGETVQTTAKFDQTDALVALTTSHTAYRLSEPGSTPSPLKLVSGEWEPAVGVASFFSNLYLLDASHGQIWRHVAKDDSYEAGSPFVIDGTALDDAVSLAIDGSIYVLKQDGAILKLTRGKRDGFTVNNLPSSISLTDARAIWTNANTSSLFVLTKSSMVELTKTGSYSRRYVSPAFTNLRAFVVDETSKQAWVLNDTTAYELNLSGS